MLSAHFRDVASFLYMGGYGAYVWPAYGIVALVLVGQVWQVSRAAARFLAVTQKKWLSSQNGYHLPRE